MSNTTVLETPLPFSKAAFKDGKIQKKKGSFILKSLTAFVNIERFLICGSLLNYTKIKRGLCIHVAGLIKHCKHFKSQRFCKICFFV